MQNLLLAQFKFFFIEIIAYRLFYIEKAVKFITFYQIKTFCYDDIFSVICLIINIMFLHILLKVIEIIGRNVV